MREIKFRVWDNDDKQMISPDYISRDGIGFWKSNSIPTSSDKLMQYTGIKDNNDKEVYEGDIVKIEYENGKEAIGKVVWDDRTPWMGWGYEISNGNQEYSTERFMHNSMDFGCKYKYFCPTVIGNIWENPELLK